MEKETSIEEMEWMSQRMTRFTASEISKLFQSGKKKDEYFGEGARTYIATKLAERLTMDVKEQVDFKQAEWGKENEAAAVKAFEKLIGKKGTYYGVSNPKFFTHEDHAGCSPDWEIEGEEGADIKCPYNSSEHVKNLLLSSATDLEKTRWEYYCQGQCSMYIRGWKRFHFVSYDPRMVESKYRLKVLTIYPDELWVNEFKDRLEAAILMLNDMEVKLSGAVLYSYDKEISTTLIQSA